MDGSAKVIVQAKKNIGKSKHLLQLCLAIFGFERVFNPLSKNISVLFPWIGLTCFLFQTSILLICGLNIEKPQYPCSPCQEDELALNFH
jgi:hypothetical protein